MNPTKRTLSVNAVLILFAIAFILFFFIGIVAGGDMDWPEASGLYGFFYAALPKLFSRALSLEMQYFAKFPMLTLISSLSFAVLAILLFCSRSKENPIPLTDCDLLSFAPDVVLIFPYFTLLSSVIIAPFLGGEYQSRGFIMFLPILALMAEIVLLFFRERGEKGAFRCRLARILSGVSAAMAVAGFVRLAQQWRIESFILFPVRVGTALVSLSEKLNGKIIALPIILIILAALAMVTVLGFLTIIIACEISNFYSY